MSEKVILKVENIWKVYPNGIVANRDVNFEVHEGEIHALIGENGADYMYRQSDVASEIVAIIEGLVIVLVAATAFLASLRHKMTARVSRELAAKGGGK